jgi:hypothetical protein
MYINKIKNILLAILVSSGVLVTSNAYAENTEGDFSINKEEEVKNYSGIGVTAGYASSLGFTYRRFFADRWAYKVTGVAFLDTNQAFGTAGLQGMYVFSETDWGKFYGLVGVSNFTMGRKSYNYTPSYSYSDPSNPDYVYIPPRGNSSIESFNNIGAGIGLEVGKIAEGVSLAIELPLTFSFKGFTSLNSIYPIPQISFIYNF